MNDRDLQLVLAAFKKQHPDLLPHIKALTAVQGTPVAAAATALLQGMLEIFDHGEQARWQLRDLLMRVKKFDGGYYLALKYNATEMVHRIAIVGEFDMRESTYYSNKPPPEIQNWKSEIPAP